MVKRALVRNAVPTTPGGGTVFYVTPDRHKYIDDLEEREEAGTPNIIGAIRAGLVFHLKDTVGAKFIRSKEEAMVEHVFSSWRNIPNLHLLGPTEEVKRVPVSCLAKPLMPP